MGNTEGKEARPQGAAGGDEGIDLATVPAPLKAPLGFFQRNKRNFFFVAGTFVLGFIANAVAGDLYDRYKPWKSSDDEFIDKIIAAQKEEFASLNTNLSQIRDNLPAEGREALQRLERSLAGVERQSAGLVQQLDLARQEIETMRTVTPSRGGVGTGYDFTLAGNTSMDLAPGAVIGLERITSQGARVNLTSEGRTVFNSRHLSSGQSLNFMGAGGKECYVSLLSLRQGAPGAASFKTGCSGAT